MRCEEKEYWNGSLDETIDCQNLLVVVDKYHSGINKVHDDAFFGDFQKTHVTDLTAVEGDVDDLDYLNRKEFRQIFQIGLPSGGGIAYMLDAIEALEQIEGIKYVAPNYFEEIEDTNIQGQTQRTVISHDDYQNQWGLERIKAKEAYDILDGIELEQVKVGVIDTGISNHTDLHLDTETGKRFWFDAAQSAICSDDKTDDEDGHGTFVAGLISAVYPDVLLVPLKIDTYDGINIIHAILYAISQNISILNLSGYAIRNDVVLENGLQNYTGSLVVAGGNNGIEMNCPATYPGDQVLVVGGTKANSDLRAEGIDWPEYENGSAYSSTDVDLFAPGTQMISTNNYDGYNYNAYGTSFAAPLVTGTAAMIKAIEPSLSTSQIKSLILSQVDVVSGLSGKCTAGGRLNVLKAIRALVHEVTFQVNGGNGGTSSIYVKDGDLLPNISLPTKTGYSFTSYVDAQGTIFYNGSTPLMAYTVESDMTLTAVWTTKQWTLTIQTYIADTEIVDGSTVEMVYDQPHPTYGTQVTAPDIEGYTFVEWRKYYAYFQLNDESIYTSYTEKTVTIYNVLPATIYGDQIFFTAVYQPACIAEGTLITLADGSQKAVEDLTGDEMLLVWNLYTGTFDIAPILFIDSDPVGQYQVIQLSFSDGTTVDVISEHGFFDIDLNKYVYLDAYAAEYIGHAFWKQGENGMTAVTLVDVEISTEVTVAYSPVTYGHLCYYVNGMLSMPGGIGGLFNIFEIDAETMKYDAEAMAADIAQYGLYTYEELNALVPVPEVMFDAVNGQYLKVAVGKGIVTLEQIGELVERYSDLFA